MKTKSLLPISGLYVLILLLMVGLIAQSQIQFQGLAIDHEGTAAWDADGTGPEPLASGHSIPLPGFTNQPYYGATRDFVDEDPVAAGFHLMDGITGFPLFNQALIDNGFNPEQIKVKFGLCSLGDDVQGEDWFIIGSQYFTNYYNLEYIFELDGEMMVSGLIAYSNYSVPSSGATWVGEYAFTSPLDASGGNSASVQEVASAFIQDLGGAEMHVTHTLTTSSYFNENGRNGRFMDVANGTITKGLPSIPFQGLEENHEGVAFWDTELLITVFFKIIKLQLKWEAISQVVEPFFWPIAALLFAIVYLLIIMQNM